MNATAAGGGVAELLSRIIPIHLALGISTDWRLIYGDKDFFTITKGFHNALQGGELDLTADAKQAYLDHNRTSAEMLREDNDLFVVHDPQPAALRHFKKSLPRSKWIWRCHIDSSEPNQEVWEFLHPYIQEYDAAVFTMKAFQDDPQGWEILDKINAEAADDPDLYVFTNLTGVGSMEVNAFQRAADVVVQKSIREGFGLVVAEAFWKSRPIVAGRAGGIPLQFPAGYEDYLVESVEDCAAKIRFLLEHKDIAENFGRAGQAKIRAEFLLPRLIRDELRLIKDVMA